MADIPMTPNQPYLLRAVFEWIVDNQCTPHLLVDAGDERIRVPREHIRDGQIVLNINPSAVGQFHWDNDHIEFSARFGGVARQIWIPMTAVRAIYARENGEGMAFTPVTPDAADGSAAGPTPPDEPAPTPPSAGRGHLKVIK